MKPPVPNGITVSGVDACELIDTLADSAMCSGSQRKALVSDVGHLFGNMRVDPRARQRRSSGIATSMQAFEASVKASSGFCTLRFIADPLAWSAEPTETESLVLSWAVSYGQEVLGAIRPVLQVVALNAAGFQGNFKVWLGSSADVRGRTSAKLYLNPWLGPRSVLENNLLLLLSAGIDVKRIASGLKILHRSPPFLPHVFGVNLNARGIGAAKMYVVLPAASLSDVREIAGRQGVALSEKLRVLERGASAEQGEVHMTIGYAAGRPEPSVGLQFPAKSWFDSEQSAGQVVSDLFAREEVELRTVCLSWPSRATCSFVGISDTAAYFYVTPS